MLTTLRGTITNDINTNAALARRLGVALLGYESGPGNNCSDFPSQESQDQMFGVISAGYSHPRMKDLMTEFYSVWKNAGGGALNQFNDIGQWSKYGCWPLLKDGVMQDPATSPTYQGIAAFIAANP